MHCHWATAYLLVSQMVTLGGGGYTILSGHLVPFQGGRTNTASALGMTRRSVFGRRGDRQDAPNFVLAFTDGMFTLDIVFLRFYTIKNLNKIITQNKRI